MVRKEREVEKAGNEPNQRLSYDYRE